MSGLGAGLNIDKMNSNVKISYKEFLFFKTKYYILEDNLYFNDYGQKNVKAYSFIWSQNYIEFIKTYLNKP